MNSITNIMWSTLYLALLEVLESGRSYKHYFGNKLWLIVAKMMNENSESTLVLVNSLKKEKKSKAGEHSWSCERGNR